VVGDQTIQAILKPAQALSMLAVGRRFCRTPSCEVVYYGDDGRKVEKRDTPIRVGLKETEDPVPLCYCFGVSRFDVRREIAASGRCTVPARIAAEVRAGHCSCEVKNPLGACCLGDVNRAVKEEQDAVQAGTEKRTHATRTAITD
jgi:hypothetical protein